MLKRMKKHEDKEHGKFHEDRKWKVYFNCIKVNRKVQGMPQSQTAANPRHKEEEKKGKNIKGELGWNIVFAFVFHSYCPSIDKLYPI